MNGDWSPELKPKRVVFPMAGKGEAGKTTVVATLAEWYASNGFKVAMFDMDPDNKAEGSLFSFFPEALPTILMIVMVFASYLIIVLHNIVTKLEAIIVMTAGYIVGNI